jgi:thiamine biosynthesis lipoprotein
MGCELALWVVARDPRAASRRLAEARAFVDQAEARLSRFLPNSELSRLNAVQGRPVRVSRTLWQAVSLALESARRTDGLYDPTVIDALEAVGYDRPFDELRAGPAGQTTSAAPPEPRSRGWRGIQLEPGSRSVRLPLGERLDLGGVGKAWVAERAADLLGLLGPCLVDAGGDIAVRGRPPAEVGWPIGVADPRRPGIDLALLLVADRGVATSGLDYRRWRRGRKLVHHLIDPRTSRPAESDLLAATVIAADAAEANLHSLATMILGFRDALAYLAEQPAVEGLLVRRDGEVFYTRGFERYVCAWNPEHAA